MPLEGRRGLGRILVQKGVITDFQLHHALAFQRLDGRALGDVLVYLKLVTEEQILRALAEQTGQPFDDVATMAATARHLDEREAALRARERELAEREQRIAVIESALSLVPTGREGDRAS
jgi:hypothetical protein